MQPTTPWLRKMKVTFSNGNAHGNGYEKSFWSDGTLNTLRISARIEKYVASMPAATQLMMYNMSLETRNSFTRNETKVMIEAGWENSGMSIVFRGDFLTAQTNRRGADTITTIFAASAHDALVSTLVNKTWGGGAKVEWILRDLVASLDGVTMGYIKNINATVGDRGYSMYGSAGNILNSLAREFGFSWTIDDGIFQAIGDKNAIATGPLLQAPYLIDANPLLSGAQQWTYGIKATTTFNFSLQPGHVFSVKSVDSLLNGTYYAAQVSHNLDCYESRSFITEVQGFSTNPNPR